MLPLTSGSIWGAVLRVGLSARYQLEGRRPGSLLAATMVSRWFVHVWGGLSGVKAWRTVRSGVDFAPALEGPAQRQLVGVLEVAADG